MASFQNDVLDHLGYVIGGTASTATTVGNGVTRFWSGHHNNDDGTGIQVPNGEPTFLGCYSTPPGGITATPVGIILPRSYTAVLNFQGPEENTDLVDLLILLAPADPIAQMPHAATYRDLVPAQLRAHMTLKDSGGTPTPNILQAFARDGRFGELTWAQTIWWGWRFTIEIRRLPIETYTA